MPIQVQDADGTLIEFPDGTPHETIAGVMRRRDQEREARTRAAPSAADGPGGAIGAAVGALRLPGQAERDEVARRAAQRQVTRNLPFGQITQPLINMATDPARRRNVAESTERFVRDVQSLPSLDLGRVAQDISNSIQQGVRDLPQTAGNIVQNLPELARAITYGPFQDEERAMQQLDIARALGDEPGVRNAAAEANRQTANAGLNVAAPVLMGGNPSVLRAGATAAALDAPFALSRNAETESLQERLPDAATEIGGVGLFGAGAQATVNAGGALSRMLPSRGAEMVQRMDRAGASVDAAGAPATPRGVTPSLATANRGAGVSAPATNLVADNIFAGAPTRGRLRQSATELRDAVNDVRDAYGRPAGREATGRRIQEGLADHAGRRGIPNPRPGSDPLRVPTREWSVASKADAVYDQVLRPIEGNAAQLSNTQATLAQLLQRADSPLVRAFNADPVLSRFRSTVERLTRRGQNGGQGPTLRDLRELRRGVRDAQNRVRIGPDSVDNAALQRIEGALTQDIYTAAGQTADALRRADQYYARAMRRIDGVRRFFDPENPAASLQQILRAAAPRTENTRVLAALRSALPDDEWRMVAASLIDEMGAPNPGAAGFVAEQGFSIANFARNYRNMTPRARRILFGSRGGQGGQSAATMRQLADDLDNLAVIADAQKAVAAGANSSGSATHLQNIVSIGGLVNPGTAGATVMGVLGGLLTGEMLTNPGFVRWLVSAQRRGGGRQGMRQALAGLQNLAARDPALWPAVEALQAQLQDQQYTPEPAAAGGRADMPRQREPALQ